MTKRAADLTERIDSYNLGQHLKKMGVLESQQAELELELEAMAAEQAETQTCCDALRLREQHLRAERAALQMELGEERVRMEYARPRLLPRPPSRSRLFAQPACAVLSVHASERPGVALA